MREFFFMGRSIAVFRRICKATAPLVPRTRRPSDRCARCHRRLLPHTRRATARRRPCGSFRQLRRFTCSSARENAGEKTMSSPDSPKKSSLPRSFLHGPDGLAHKSRGRRSLGARERTAGQRNGAPSKFLSRERHRKEPMLKFESRMRRVCE